ncbi:hypothetical protein OG883_33700 [Streptomyces sp. NBC_01142]|uniref:hypothetical protein n=1 Tax=Streptomyces sp. NBC_01142 TaxID=2975865 RepID=UPI00225B2409|nr:hypothetical protein [Streptomyces sp. NBC_01142]MCX4824727.1 hypothetical protein [Streptomyces sp. NBC_01142]
MPSTLSGTATEDRGFIARVPLIQTGVGVAVGDGRPGDPVAGRAAAGWSRTCEIRHQALAHLPSDVRAARLDRTVQVAHPLVHRLRRGTEPSMSVLAV